MNEDKEQSGNNAEDDKHSFKYHQQRRKHPTLYGHDSTQITLTR